MSDLHNIAFEVETLSERIRAASSVVNLAMERLENERPTSTTDEARISCFIERFDLYYDALYLALNDVMETREKLLELSAALYRMNKQTKGDNT